MFTAFVTLLLAVSPFAAGRDILASSGGGVSGDGSGSDNDYDYDSDHYSASITCKAHAVAQSSSGYYSSHVRAVAGAFKLGCSDSWDGDVNRIRNIMMGDGYAYAWASSFSKAKAVCSGTKGTKGCALASAYSDAFASATAKGVAKAWAKAVNKCSCQAKAKAKAFGKATKIVQLYASAWTDAFAKACTKDDEYAFAEAETNCYAHSSASIWATAIAKAIIKGGCHTKLKSKAEIKAKVDIYTYNSESCHSSFEAWNGEARTSGSAYADDYEAYW